MRESALLEHIYGFNHELPAGVIIPPGDDAGMVRLGGRDVLVAVDQVADGVHVDLSTTPLEKVARKAITRNLSDVAAMAARPVAAVVAAALPRGFGAQRAEQLVDAMRAVAAAYGCPLVGGDVSIWDHPLLISVTVLAEPYGDAPVTRRGAQVGDVVCVTGHLGGSLIPHEGYTHHLDFEPRLEVARQLAADTDLALHCMIDLSDGLAADVAQLCRAADGAVGAQLWADRLPISPAAHAASHRDHTPTWRHALGDGEDYELCFTVSPTEAERVLPAQIDGVPVTRVGIITPAEPAELGRSGASGAEVVTLVMPDGSVEPVGPLGWEHHG
jgi:thiamine-monophosphate kinase